MRLVIARLGGVVVVVMLAGVLSASAQRQDTMAKRILRIRNVAGSKVRTPEYKLVGGTAQGVKRIWFEVLVDYETTPEWIDELDFTYYVLMRSRRGKKRYVLFRGDVSYVNIARGRHRSVVYVHPSTLERYGDVDRVAVLIKSQGRLVGVGGRPAPTKRWWEQLTPVKGYILTRMQTPFAMIRFDDYEAIKANTPR